MRVHACGSIRVSVCLLALLDQLCELVERLALDVPLGCLSSAQLTTSSCLGYAAVRMHVCICLCRTACMRARIGFYIRLHLS